MRCVPGFSQPLGIFPRMRCVLVVVVSFAFPLLNIFLVSRRVYDALGCKQFRRYIQRNHMHYAAHTHAYSHNIIHTCTPQAHARSDTHVRVHVPARMGVSVRVLPFFPLCVCV